MKLFAIALAVAGCDRRAPIESCEQDLGGEYVAVASAGSDEDQRWLVIDHGSHLEIYPGFADVPAAGTLEVAPRVIDLRRVSSGTLVGETKRRYMQGAASCLAKAPARLARCADDTLEIVHADTAPPLAFEPCQFGRTDPARVERWKRR